MQPDEFKSAITTEEFKATKASVVHATTSTPMHVES
jgi:hypothetical protein